MDRRHSPLPMQVATSPPLSLPTIPIVANDTSPTMGNVRRIVQHQPSPTDLAAGQQGKPTPRETSGSQQRLVQSSNSSTPPIWSATPSAHAKQVQQREHAADDKPTRRSARQDSDGANRDRSTGEGRREHSASRSARDSNAVGISLMTRSTSSKAPYIATKDRTLDGESEVSDTRASTRRHTQQRHGGVEEGAGERRHHNSRAGPRNDGEGHGSASRSTTGSAGGGKLFDPRRDDPVRFATLRKGLGVTASSIDASTAGGSMSITSQSDARSLASSAAPSITTMSTTSSDGREKRRRRGPGSRTTTDSGGGGGAVAGDGSSKRKGQTSAGASDGAASDNNSYVIELKRRYREVAVLERKLQEEHRLASERLRRYQAEATSSTASTSATPTIGSLMTRSSSFSRANTAERHGFHADGSLLHNYWLDLIAQHRILAELHVAFMEAALRPGLPASLHSLPQTYKIPTRLWHTAFHSLLERFRHTLPDWQACIALRDQGISMRDRQHISEILDLLTEYIYFAYSYYTNLLESELFKDFRSAWIENLGDLARYRMAVAKIMVLLGVKDGVHHGAERRDSGGQGARPTATSLMNEGPRDASESAVVRRNAENGGEEIEGDDEGIDAAEEMSARMGKDQASVGAAAAEDWDLEEREIWRSTARGWYAKGLADMPGTGRLHHHLGVLSRDDDLRGLYHFCKSLTTSHPYPNARESMLPLFERSAQARRVGEDATLIDLFVHIHGILFTRVQLDDFDAVFDRYKRQMRREIAGDDARDGALSPSSWMMMATINIAAIFQYGDSRGQGRDGEEERAEKHAQLLADQEGYAVAPARETGAQTDDDGDEGEEDEDADICATVEPVSRPERDEQIDLPPPFTVMALRLAFDMLDELVSLYLHDLKSTANPYITILLTYFSQECRQDGVMRSIEQYVPWEQLVALGNAVPTTVEPVDPRKETSLKIRGDAVPLPEDWCLRGMAWVGRRVYERGFWRPHKVERLGLRRSIVLFESEMDMIDRCTHCPYRAQHDSGESSGEGEDDDEDEDTATTAGQVEEGVRPRLTLGLLRWKRIVHALTILVKTVPGLDFDIASGGSVHARYGRLLVAPPLLHRLVAWQAEATRTEVEQAIGHMKLAALEGVLEPPVSAGLDDDDDDDDDDFDEDATDDDDLTAHSSSVSGDKEDAASDEVRDLMRRRVDLRRQLRDARSLNVMRSGHSPSPTKGKGPTPAAKASAFAKKGRDATTRQPVRVVPGYTTLVLDTNVMLAPTHILRQLVESKNWLVVVPLSVITELDGLKRRTTEVGKRAQEAITYLESTIKTVRRVKVQTSRGNYLTDLSFRVEDIDFAAVSNAADTVVIVERSPHKDVARSFSSSDATPRISSEVSGGDAAPSTSSAARSVDDVILRCLAWQAGSHFRDRLLLFCTDDTERMKREEEVAKATAPPVARAVLVTLDRNLRIKARFCELDAIGPSDLVNLLLNVV